MYGSRMDHVHKLVASANRFADAAKILNFGGLASYFVQRKLSQVSILLYVLHCKEFLV